jgi:CDP-diacylglycerol--glycerol-3-phosphate 3-phosphatidyltransferase
MEHQVQMPKEKLLNIPNILSLYRLISFPFVLIIAFEGYQRLFVVLFIINLITDILDGLIARLFKMETKIGARLDSYADLGCFILAIVGIILFKSKDFEPHILSIIIFLIFFIAPYIFSLLKFGKLPSLHLYSSKIAGYLQGIFFFILFIDKFYEWFYFITIIYAIMTFIEEIIVQLLINEMRSNLKGLYWIIKSK